ncbi:MAG: outer membrane lipoprotein-sorting protein, partial [Thermodesulfobacteriota bacterium]
MTGRELAQRVFDRENGNDATARMQMILVDESNKERTREFTAYRKDAGPLSMQVIRFSAPADIQGTAFLSIEKPGSETEQFLYL